MTTLPKSTPTYAAKKPALVTQPSPVLLTRKVKRHVALCLDESCEFNRRKPMKLHSSSAAAQVEAGRHIRDVHAAGLSAEVEAKRSRQVVNESIEIASE